MSRAASKANKRAPDVAQAVDLPSEPKIGVQLDPRTFKVRRNGRASEASIERQHVLSWAPSPQSRDLTLVTMDNGKAMQVHCPFREFHAWVISPALERDKHHKETLAAKKDLKEKPKARRQSKSIVNPSITEELITIA